MVQMNFPVKAFFPRHAVGELLFNMLFEMRKRTPEKINGAIGFYLALVSSTQRRVDAPP